MNNSIKKLAKNIFAFLVLSLIAISCDFNNQEEEFSLLNKNIRTGEVTSTQSTNCDPDNFNLIKISDYLVSTPTANGTEGIRVYLTGNGYPFTVFVRVSAYHKKDGVYTMSAAAKDYYFLPNGPTYVDQSLEEDYYLVCKKDKVGGLLDPNPDEGAFKERTLIYKIEGVYRFNRDRSISPLEPCYYDVVIDKVEGTAKTFCYEFNYSNDKSL